MPNPDRPLFRTTLTIVPPWDPTSDVTIEVVVLATDQDDSATRADCPELAEAGWIANSVKGLEVCLRIVG